MTVETVNLLSFSAGGFNFAADAGQICGMAACDDLSDSSLIWLHEILGIECNAGSYTSPTMLAVNGEPPAIVVIDNLMELSEYPLSAIKPLPQLVENYSARCGVWGIIPAEDGNIILLDLEKMIRRIDINQR